MPKRLLKKQEEQIALAMKKVEGELRSAMIKFPKPFNSEHEGYGVLLEEMDELWDEVKDNKAEGSRERQHEEAIQVAAMAIKYIIQLPIKTK